ncbi:hypothetical protein CGC50_03435 [Capnocytophaga gingivalis]|uniref:Lipoprotein n=1 Tax=Capnocytophaga gingivalis TaxID=1017 RepID=A0A250FMH1_9FLAO|nr:hypothetical protein [Capnocytophaga gingivalis]ATA86293.1 hypothetical protein CGC50_03435 [Capnocytophaga gingivalis]
MKVNLFLILFALFSCVNNNSSKKTEKLDVCIIPNNVLSYIQSNKDFELIDAQKQFSEDFWRYYNIQKNQYAQSFVMEILIMITKKI